MNHYFIINIGTNLGDRRLNLSRAMAAVIRHFGEIEMSHVVETEPQGFESSNKFLNLGIMFRSELEPLEVLGILRDIEKEISPASHRTPDGGYVDRLLDIDIIAIDDLVIDTPELQVPHPRMAQRDFVLVPLEEIAPSWCHPISGLTATQMLAALKSE